MMHAHALLPVLAILLSLAACTTSSPGTLATPTSLFPEAPSTAANGAPSSTPEPGTASVPSSTTQPAPAEPQFTVAAVVDATTEHATREQALALVVEAALYLRPFSPIGLLMTDFTEDGGGGSVTDMANRYIGAHAAALPNGLVIFSFGDNSEAKSTGGYGTTVPAAGGFRNAFVSPQGARDRMYIAVVDASYKYMACGYGGSEAVQSASALPGECRGQTGIACVQGSGYSICSNALGNLYTSTPTHAAASMIVHGLLHNFGPNGDADHYATPECNSRMGYPAGFFDLQESEYYNGLCPYVYEDFTKAYQP